MQKLFKLKLKTLNSTLFSITFLPLVLRDVHEYLDLGTGSMLIQILIASFVGGAFIIKLYWGKMKANFHYILRRDKNRNDES